MGSSSMGSLGAGLSLSQASVLLRKKWASQSLPRILPRSVPGLKDNQWVYSPLGNFFRSKHEALLTITSCVILLTVIQFLDR